MNYHYYRIVAYTIAGIAIAIVQLGYIELFNYFRLSRFISSNIFTAVFVLIHITSVLLLGWRVFRLNIVGVSVLATFLLSLGIIIWAELVGEGLIGLLIIPVFVENTIGTIILFVLSFWFRPPVRSCCRVSEKVGIKEKMLGGPRCKRDYFEVARDQSGWEALLKCRNCGSYWEVDYRRSSGKEAGLDGIRPISAEDANSKYLLER